MRLTFASYNIHKAVGADLAQDGDDAVGIAAPVAPDPLVDVVAGERELHARLNAA